MRFCPVFLALAVSLASASLLPSLGTKDGALGDLPLLGEVENLGKPVEGLATNLPLVGQLLRRDDGLLDGLPIINGKGGPLGKLPIVGGGGKGGPLEELPIVRGGKGGNTLQGLPVVGQLLRRDEGPLAGLPIIRDETDFLEDLPVVGDSLRKDVNSLEALPIVGGEGGNPSEALPLAGQLLRRDDGLLASLPITGGKGAPLEELPIVGGSEGGKPLEVLPTVGQLLRRDEALLAGLPKIGGEGGSLEKLPIAGELLRRDDIFLEPLPLIAGEAGDALEELPVIGGILPQGGLIRRNKRERRLLGLLPTSGSDKSVASGSDNSKVVKHSPLVGGLLTNL